MAGTLDRAPSPKARVDVSDVKVIEEPTSSTTSSILFKIESFLSVLSKLPERMKASSSPCKRKQAEIPVRKHIRMISKLSVLLLSFPYNCKHDKRYEWRQISIGHADAKH